MIKGTEPFVTNPEQRFTEAAVTKDKRKRRRKRKKKGSDDDDDGYLDKATRSFDALAKSKEHRGIIDSYYGRNAEGEGR